MQYLESECDVLTRLNTKMSDHMEMQTKNIDLLKKKLKLYKEREKRDKEAMEAAERE